MSPQCLKPLLRTYRSFPIRAATGSASIVCSRGFFRSWQIDVGPSPSPYAWERRASANLSQVAPRARQAFLLNAVEGFSTKQNLRDTRRGAGGVYALLTQAAEEISQQVATDILIIEDEPLIAMDIEQMVLSLGHRVTGIARTRSEALTLFKADPPGMVLADIQLADGSSGIDAVNDILEATPCRSSSSLPSPSIC